MQNEQVKTALVNVVIVAAVVGVIAAGYFMFINKPTEAPSTGVAQSTAAMSVEVAQMVTLLEDLDNSVKNSVAVFSLPAFKSLEDFSVGVSPEPVGRENPFIPTTWRLNNMKIGDTTTGSKASAPTKATPVTAQSENLFGDFTQGDTPGI